MRNFIIYQFKIWILLNPEKIFLPKTQDACLHRVHNWIPSWFNCLNKWSGENDHSISFHLHFLTFTLRLRVLKSIEYFRWKMFQKENIYDTRTALNKRIFFSLCKFYITANNLQISGQRRGFRCKAAFILSASLLEWCLYKSTASPSQALPAGNQPFQKASFSNVK